MTRQVPSHAVRTAVAPLNLIPAAGGCGRSCPSLRRHLITASFLILLLAAMLPGVSPAAPPPETGTPVPPPNQPINFNEAVQIALLQSPLFTKSAIDIQISKMDEADSRWSMGPSFTLRSYYYVNQPTGLFGLKAPNPYVLYFTSDAYNPLGAYFSLQAQKLATDAAIIVHTGTISKGLKRMGSLFLELYYLKEMTTLQNELINLAREKINFIENRANLGTASSLEVRIASQELAVAKADAERFATAQKQDLEALKSLLGYKSSQPLGVNLADARHQVLNEFSPNTINLEQAKGRSPDLKVLEIKSKLQEYNIMLAKTRMLPNLMVNAQTPDPLNFSSGRGLYVGFGLEVPVWDGFHRLRNVSRQKAKLKQAHADQETGEIKLEEQFRRSQEKIADLAAAKTLAQTQEELARLKVRQAEIRYQAGEEPLTTLLDAKKGVGEAKKNIVAKSLDYEQAVLELYELTGELSHTYVEAKSSNQ